MQKLCCPPKQDEEVLIQWCSWHCWRSEFLCCTAWGYIDHFQLFIHAFWILFGCWFVELQTAWKQCHLFCICMKNIWNLVPSPSIHLGFAEDFFSFFGCGQWTFLHFPRISLQEKGPQGQYIQRKSYAISLPAEVTCASDQLIWNFIWQIDQRIHLVDFGSRIWFASQKWWTTYCFQLEFVQVVSSFVEVEQKCPSSIFVILSLVRWSFFSLVVDSCSQMLLPCSVPALSNFWFSNNHGQVICRLIKQRNFPWRASIGFSFLGGDVVSKNLAAEELLRVIGLSKSLPRAGMPESGCSPRSHVDTCGQPKRKEGCPLHDTEARLNWIGQDLAQLFI